MRSDQRIELSSDYQFYVTIKQGEFSFSGVLNLTPQKITLRFGGDAQPDRRYEYEGEKLEILNCHNVSYNFILCGLHNVGFHAHYLPDNPIPIRHFDLVYEVDSIIACPVALEASEISNVEIHSSTFNEWLGLTTTQDDILSAYQQQSDTVEDDNDSDTSTVSVSDFFCTIEGFGYIYQRYNIEEFSSMHNYGAGVSFPPSLCIDAAACAEPTEIIQLYSKVYNFFSVLHGDELLVECIELRSSQDFSWRSGFLYYPALKDRLKFSKSYSFFPLGRNLKFRTQDLPELSEKTFENYFRLDEKHQGVWGKYIKYRRMKSIEERFLGYFRLLETLTLKSKVYLDPGKLDVLSKRFEPFFVKYFGDRKSVKSFFERLPRFNASKYNTEKCMVDFYKSMPSAFKEKLKLDHTHIHSICQLRNDISHANDYYISEDDLWGNCVFVEALLISAMFKSVGISLSDISKIIDRLH